VHARHDGDVEEAGGEGSVDGARVGCKQESHRCKMANKGIA
jgi:hypothetical protein